jgi:hypothetical protein
MDLGNTHIGDPARSSMPPQWNHHTRLDEPYLTPQKRQTRINFSREWITIIRWSVLDHIRNKYLRTIQPSPHQQTI